MRNINNETISEIFWNYDPSLRVELFKVKPGSQKAHFCSLIYTVEFIEDGKYFIKEIEMYNKIVPKVMKPAGLSESFPPIYYTFAKPDSHNYYIAMEDLTENGYKQYSNRIEGLDEHHTKFVIKKLAHFHAASFMQYKGDGFQLEADYPDIKEHFWKTDLEKNHVPQMNHSVIFNTVEQIRKLLTNKGMEHGIQCVESLMNMGHEILSKLGTVSKQYPSVITHGDAWTTNFLFKYEDNTDNLISMKFIDFQMSRITSRMTDLAYFIYTSINTGLLNNNLNELLHLYFDTFNNICLEVGQMQPPLTFKGCELNWEHFMKEWSDYQVYGQVFGLLHIPIMYTDPENAIDMEKIDVTDVEVTATSKEKKGTFDDIWNYKPMQDRLFNLIFKHLLK